MKRLNIVLIMLMIAFSMTNIGYSVFANTEQNRVDLETTSFLNIINENYYFYINTETNKVIKVQDGVQTEFGEYGKNEGQFTDVKYFKVLKNNEIVIVDSLKKLHFFDTNFNHKKTLQTVLDGQYYDIGNILDITEDLYGNIYLLDETNNKILKANSTLEDLAVSKTLTQSYTNLLINTNGDFLLSNQTNLHLLGGNSVSLENDIEDIYVDALNFVYVKTSTKIIKLNSSFEIISASENASNLYYNLNIENGNFYSLNPQSLQIEILTGIGSDVENFQAPIDILDGNSFNSQLNLAKITDENCYLLSSPFAVLSDKKLNVNTEVIILTNNFDPNLDYAYCLYADGSTTQLGYIKNSTYENINNTHTETLTPIRSKIAIYKLPLKNLNESSLKLGELEYNVNYTSTQKITFNNVVFYEINLNNNYYYVLDIDLLSSNNNYINTYLKSNAQVKPFGNFSEVKIYLDKDLSTEYKTITTPLNVQSKKLSKTICEIQFLEDNEIITCYVEKQFVFENENNFVIPFVIILMLLCLIILTILLIKFKKESKQKNV